MITAQGIGSGLDVASIVAQLVSAEGQPAFLRLSTREASIQSQISALGSLKSALSQFQEALNPIKELEQFRSRKTSSADEDFFTATATTSAVPSSYDIEVVNLAEAHKLATGAYADAETPVGYGTLTFQLGNDPESKFVVTIDPEPPVDPDDPTPPGPSNTTLEAIRDAINSAADNTGVGASIVEAEDGAHQVITSNQTGVEHQLTITAAGGDGGLEALEFGVGVVNPEMTELQAAVDATIRVDSFTRTSSSNSVTDIIDGVTINLTGAEAGVTTKLTVEFDQSVAKAKVKKFVDSYNTLTAAFAEFSKYNAETKTASTLLGDSTLRDVSSALRREIGGGGVQGYGFYRSLSVIGITTETDGKLTLDENKLSASLSDDFDAVGRIFADDDGFATRLASVLTPFVESGGQIDSRTDGLKKDIDLITSQREKLDLRLASVEQRYLRQFSALDGIISQLTTTSSFLSQQLSNLPSANFNRN